MSRLRAVCFILLALCSPSHAMEVPGDILSAAKRFNVPAELMYAIMLSASRNPSYPEMGPWPWSVYHNDQHRFFKSRGDAYQYVLALYLKGEDNFHVGWSLINWNWYSHLFERLWMAFDPSINVAAGCAILRELYRRTGSFYLSVARYPSHGVDGQVFRRQVQDILRSTGATFQLVPHR